VALYVDERGGGEDHMVAELDLATADKNGMQPYTHV
jgi:hypothetical protein